MSSVSNYFFEKKRFLHTFFGLQVVFWGRAVYFY